MLRTEARMRAVESSTSRPVPLPVSPLTRVASRRCALRGCNPTDNSLDSGAYAPVFYPGQTLPQDDPKRYLIDRKSVIAASIRFRMPYSPASSHFSWSFSIDSQTSSATL